MDCRVEIFRTVTLREEREVCNPGPFSTWRQPLINDLSWPKAERRLSAIKVPKLTFGPRVNQLG